MGLLSWLTGESETAGKVVDGVSSGLDMMFYTDEEKAIAAHKVLDFKIEYAKHTQNQSVARRVIAFIVAGLWGFLNLLAVLLYFISEDSSNFVFKVINENINMPFMIIVGFYFAAHIVGKLKT